MTGNGDVQWKGIQWGHRANRVKDSMRSLRVGRVGIAMSVDLADCFPERVQVGWDRQRQVLLFRPSAQGWKLVRDRNRLVLHAPGLAADVAGWGVPHGAYTVLPEGDGWYATQTPPPPERESRP